MAESINEKVRRWNRDANAPVDFLSIWEQIVYISDKRFYEYHPTIGPYPDFRARLRSWINCAHQKSDQQILFQLVPLIFFVGSQEFNSLYRIAYNGPVIRWLVDNLDLSFSEATIGNHIDNALRETWFCPITDSMQIAAFYHVNNIEGKDYRPDWRSLQRFGNPQLIKEYMQKEGLKRLVLLEDFVGSGSQIKGSVEFAANTLSSPYKILVIPLIVCPDGNELGRQLATCYSNLTFEPVLIMGDHAFVQAYPTGVNETDLVKELRDLVQRLHPLVTGSTSDLSKKLYGPFGFADTGSLLVMYTNCPDNTLTIIHNKSNTWDPLFPRSSRV